MLEKDNFADLELISPAVVEIQPPTNIFIRQIHFHLSNSNWSYSKNATLIKRYIDKTLFHKTLPDKTLVKEKRYSIKIS